MPKIPESGLSWNDTHQKWRRTYRGKQWQSKKCNKSDRVYLSKCKQDVEAWIKTVDADLVASDEIEQTCALAERLQQDAIHKWVQLKQFSDKMIGRLPQRVASGVLSVADNQLIIGEPAPAFQVPAIEPFAVQAIHASCQPPVIIDESRILSVCLKEFYAIKLADAKHKDVSTNRANNLNLQIKKFVEWAQDCVTDCITGDKLFEYRQYLRANHTTNTARDYFQATKQFLRWCHARGRYVLPLNFDHDELAMSTEVKAVKVWTLDEWKAAIKVADDRNRLYLLLMLNCGMTQKDIADIKDKQVNWTKGTITRRRSKLEKWEQAPIVTYRLWPETFALLKQFRTGGERVLLSDDGSVLVDDRNNDNIAQNWERHCKRNKVKFLPLKYIRKTGATALAKMPNGLNIAQRYLADVPSGVMLKNYVQPDEQDFAECLAALRASFSVDDSVDGFGRQQAAVSVL